MKLRVVAEGTYSLPDDPNEREEIYGTEDPDECAEIDEQGTLRDLLAMCGDVTYRVEVVRDED